MEKDRETFTALVDEHGAAVLAMLRRLCGNPHDADDLFQDVRELDQLQCEADLLDARRDADALELRFAPRTALNDF